MSSRTRVRRDVLRSMLTLANAAPTDVSTFLTDRDPDIRRSAIAVLCQVTDDWTIPSVAVARALTDPEPASRAAAADLLRDMYEIIVPSAAFHDALVAATRHPESRIRVAAINSLWRHRLATLADLRKWLASPDAAVRLELAEAFTHYRALPELLALHADPEENVRIAVARGIAAGGDPRGGSIAEKLVTDSSPRVSAAALTALARTGLATDDPYLVIDMVSSPSTEVRAAAATALRLLASETAIPALTHGACDREVEVRREAVRTVADAFSADDGGRRLLTQALRDPDTVVVAYARYGIAHPRLRR